MAWRVLEVKVIDEEIASDHRPVLAVIEWVPPDQRERQP
jgi:endonuclease/exonuclease/phosphatase family metal-dependent hydrolase